MISFSLVLERKMLTLVEYTQTGHAVTLDKVWASWPSSNHKVSFLSSLPGGQDSMFPREPFCLILRMRRIIGGLREDTVSVTVSMHWDFYNWSEANSDRLAVFYVITAIDLGLVYWPIMISILPRKNKQTNTCIYGRYLPGHSASFHSKISLWVSVLLLCEFYFQRTAIWVEIFLTKITIASIV